MNQKPKENDKINGPNSNESSEKKEGLPTVANLSKRAVEKS